MKIMRAGQQGVLLWNEKTKIGIDLFLSDEQGRLIPNIVDVEDLEDVSLLFGTHDHLDHIDREAWKKAAEIFPDIRFVVPAFFRDSLPDEMGIERTRFKYTDKDIPTEYNGIEIEAVPAAHEFLDEGKDGLHPYLIYIIRFDGKTICHMGDTCIYEGMLAMLRSFGRFDIMFIPINGRDAYRYTHDCIGNMTFQEAADVTGILAPKLAVPGHYDMFAHNSEDPQKYIDYVRVKYPGQEVMIMEPGVIYNI